MTGRRAALPLCFVLMILFSCDVASPRPAIIWTDSPDLVTIAELYNAAQPRYTVEISWRENPVKDLAAGKGKPDIIMASWLKDSRNRRHFIPLDDLFEDRLVDERSFYTKLLSQGHFGAKQYLLPVSFNIPAFVFSREQAERFATPFILTPAEARAASSAFNQFEGNVPLRIGYAPRWDGDFMLAYTSLQGTGWHEAAPLGWNDQALTESLLALRDWTLKENGSLAQEDEFTFKYLNEPRSRLLSSGRILLSCMGTRELFTLKSEQRALLDFRWVADNDIIPVREDSTWLGICKKGRARSPARDFIRWFYREDSWQSILDFYEKSRMGESVFGVGNGFSALQPVNEKIYPLFYPTLLGHIPPAEYLSLPEVLPANWPGLWKETILPWLNGAIASSDVPSSEGLSAAIKDRALVQGRTRN